MHAMGVLNDAQNLIDRAEALGYGDAWLGGGKLYMYTPNAHIEDDRVQITHEYLDNVEALKQTPVYEGKLSEHAQCTCVQIPTAFGKEQKALADRAKALGFTDYIWDEQSQKIFMRAPDAYAYYKRKEITKELLDEFEKKQDKPLLSVGDIVCITAHDWGVYNEQMHKDSEFIIVRANIYGEVVKVFDDGVAIAPQVFDDGGVRGVLTIPWSAIEDYKVYE